MIPIFDIHCHPSIKINLFNRQMKRRHQSASDLPSRGMYVDFPGMKAAGVQIIFSFHYIQEAGFGTLPKSQRLFRILERMGLPVFKKFEKREDGLDAFEKVKRSIQLTNQQVVEASGFPVTTPADWNTFQQSFAAGKIIVLHGLEGSHHLGRKLGSVQHYLDNLQQLKALGVRILTLSHFFQNDVCDSGGGVPPSGAKMLGYTKPPSQSNGLTEIGKAVVHWCQDNGVIIDLVHSTSATRAQVYRLLDSRAATGKKVRPVVFSHTGVREVAARNMTSQDDLLILPDKTEIDIIKKYGGVFGIILMNYWTIGKEDTSLFRKENGIAHVIETMRFISDCTRNFDHIAIGSDLDGYTQVPDDVKHVRFMGRLRDAIVAAFGTEAAEKICYQNALRVLEASWKEQLIMDN